MRRNRLFAAGTQALALAATLAVGGCAGPRPLNVVRDTGDRAYQTDRWAVAAANYQEFCDRKPSEPEVQYRLGMSLVEMGRAPEAREHLRIACDVMPNNDTYIEGYCKALLACNERDQLLNFLRNKTNDRGLVSDYIRLGDYAAKVGHADEAIASLKTAARIDGGKTPEPQLALAAFYGSIGDKSEQLQRVRMAYFISPGSVPVNNAIKELGETPGPRFGRVPTEVTLDTGVTGATPPSAISPVTTSQPEVK